MGCSEQQSNVLRSELGGEGGPLEVPLREQLAVGTVDGGAEHRCSEKIDVSDRVDLSLRDQSERLTRRLDHRRREEIAAELHQIRRLGLLGDEALSGTGVRLGESATQSDADRAGRNVERVARQLAQDVIARSRACWESATAACCTRASLASTRKAPMLSSTSWNDVSTTRR